MKVVWLTSKEAQYLGNAPSVAGGGVMTEPPFYPAPPNSYEGQEVVERMIEAGLYPAIWDEGIKVPLEDALKNALQFVLSQKDKDYWKQEQVQAAQWLNMLEEHKS